MVIALRTPTVVRPMTQEDLAAAVELSAEQSWPHRAEDIDLFFELGEGLVAEIDGRVIGTIMAWRFGGQFAAIGMIIVSADRQGEGIDRQLLGAMLDRLQGWSVMVNAADGEVPFYADFAFVPLFEIGQHQGPAPTMPLVDLQPGERVRPAGVNEDRLPALFSRSVGMDREAYFRRITQGSRALVLSRDHEPVGFALQRRFGRGQIIAPLVAPDLGGAKALATQCLGKKAGKFCRIDAISGTGLTGWLEEVGLPRVGTVTVMVRGAAPAYSLNPRLFAVASQAFG